MYGYCGLRFVGRVAHPAFFHWLDAPSLFLELFEERRDAFILYADNLSSSLPAGLLACLIIARIIDVDNYYFSTGRGYGVGSTYPMPICRPT